MASNSTISVRSCASASNSTSFSVVAEIPTCRVPMSTPNDTGCLYPLLPYRSWMVKGVLFTTFAFLFFNNILAFLGEHGINGLPCLLITYTNKACTSFLGVFFLFPHVGRACDVDSTVPTHQDF